MTEDISEGSIIQWQSFVGEHVGTVKKIETDAKGLRWLTVSIGNSQRTGQGFETRIPYIPERLTRLQVRTVGAHGNVLSFPSGEKSLVDSRDSG